MPALLLSKKKWTLDSGQLPNLILSEKKMDNKLWLVEKFYSCLREKWTVDLHGRRQLTFSRIWRLCQICPQDASKMQDRQFIKNARLEEESWQQCGKRLRART
uniref:Uncharacterized protein n=1 Tax=Lygus hesperus TaxID=30085 RepID=A0A0K8SRM6_LYGHE